MGVGGRGLVAVLRCWCCSVALQWHVVDTECSHNSAFRLDTHKRDFLAITTSGGHSRVFPLLR